MILNKGYFFLNLILSSYDSDIFILSLWQWGGNISTFMIFQSIYIVSWHNSRIKITDYLLYSERKVDVTDIPNKETAVIQLFRLLKKCYRLFMVFMTFCKEINENVELLKIITIIKINNNNNSNYNSNYYYGLNNISRHVDILILFFNPLIYFYAQVFKL